ncbi:MAG: hypothetical protein ACOX6T_05105 [Myxococcales bacterium]|jgi:hypothetical protein
MSTCGLCGGALTASGVRLCELDLCQNCYHGDPNERLASRRFSISSERFTTHPNDEGSVRHHLVMTGLLGRDFGVKATFRREGLGTRITKLFRKEIQTGDPFFDELVYIDGRSDPRLARLVGSPEIQGVILEFFSVPATVTLDGPFLRAEQIDDSAPPKLPLWRAMAIGLHYFERHV